MFLSDEDPLKAMKDRMELFCQRDRLVENALIQAALNILEDAETYVTDEKELVEEPNQYMSDGNIKKQNES